MDVTFPLVRMLSEQLLRIRHGNALLFESQQQPRQVTEGRNSTGEFQHV